MPLTNTQALLLSNDAFFRGLTENDPKRIQLAHLLPYHEIDGDKITIPRVTNANLGTATWDAGGTALSDTPAVPTSPNATYSLKLLASAVKNNYTAQYDMSNVNQQDEVQISAAVRRMSYQYFATLNTGNEGSNPQEFNGLRQLVTVGQTITANGGAGGQPTLAEFDQLLSLVKAADGRPTVLYSSQKGFDSWKKAHYAINVVPSDFREMEVPVAGGGSRGSTCAQAARSIEAKTASGRPVPLESEGTPSRAWNQTKAASGRASATSTPIQRRPTGR